MSRDGVISLIRIWLKQTNVNKAKALVTELFVVAADSQ